ncbi:MAG TPA: hypothetical protein VLS49_10535 [Usitatibacter sp.]|nr:hypothetical protein [Usitatibacter sp.]
MATPARLTILQLNDLHGYLEPHAELVRAADGQRHARLGGLARIASLFARVREEAGGDPPPPSTATRCTRQRWTTCCSMPSPPTPGSTSRSRTAGATARRSAVEALRRHFERTRPVRAPARRSVIAA